MKRCSSKRLRSQTVISLAITKYSLNAHRAAVKALAFCPWHRNLPTSGGETSTCKSNFDTSELVGQSATDSQVCALQWCQQEQTLLSSHGYVRNQLCVWNISN